MQSIPIRSKKAAVSSVRHSPGIAMGMAGGQEPTVLAAHPAGRLDHSYFLLRSQHGFPQADCLRARRWQSQRRPGLPRLKSIQCLGYFGQICPAGVSCRHQHQHVFIRKFRLYPSGTQSVSQCPGRWCLPLPPSITSFSGSPGRSGAAPGLPTAVLSLPFRQRRQPNGRAGHRPKQRCRHPATPIPGKMGWKNQRLDSACLASCSKGHAAPLATWR